MPIVDTIDFNGDSVPADAGQAEKTEVEEVKTEEVETDEVKTEQVETKEVETEDVETLPQWAKDRILKVETEKENYKKGMLKYKRSLDPEEKQEKQEEKTEVEYPEWNDDSKKFQEQTEKKAEIIAERKASQIIEKQNEKTAISNFISKHQELDDNDRWTDLISNYHPKNGKETPQDIEKDLERAYFMSRYERGEITDIEAKAFKKGEQKGKTEKQIADLSSISTTTQKSVKQEGNSVSEGALNLARKLRVDPAQLAKEDDSNFAIAQF